MNAEELLAPDYRGKRADPVFQAERLIAEVKSLTSDRRQDPAVREKLGEVLESAPFPCASVIDYARENVKSRFRTPHPLSRWALSVAGIRELRRLSERRTERRANEIFGAATMSSILASSLSNTPQPRGEG